MIKIGSLLFQTIILVFLKSSGFHYSMILLCLLKNIDSLKDEDIITIRGEDIEMPEEQQPVRRIGFSA